MADRAIIPGASQEFLAFMEGAFDAPNLVRENPDAGLVSFEYTSVHLSIFLFVFI